MTKEVFKRKFSIPPQPVFQPNIYFFIISQKKAIFMNLLALSYHAGFCCQGQTVQNSSKRVCKVQAARRGSALHGKEGEGSHCLPGLL